MPVVADLTMSLMLENQDDIFPPQVWWLNLNVKHSQQEYIDKLEELFLEHGISSSLGHPKNYSHGLLFYLNTKII